MNAKGFITHPVGLATITFIIGFVLALLLARGIIPIPIKLCP